MIEGQSMNINMTGKETGVKSFEEEIHVSKSWLRKTDMRIIETKIENRKKKKYTRNLMGYMAQDYSNLEVSGTVLSFLLWSQNIPLAFRDGGSNWMFTTRAPPPI